MKEIGEYIFINVKYKEIAQNVIIKINYFLDIDYDDI